MRFLRTYFSRDRRRMICLYEAPDAESVRLAAGEGRRAVRDGWAAAGRPPRGRRARRRRDRGRAHVLPRPFDEAAIRDAAAGGAWCLEQHGCRIVWTYLSGDGRRCLCVFEAPDAESVRQAQRQIGHALRGGLAGHGPRAARGALTPSATYRRQPRLSTAAPTLAHTPTSSLVLEAGHEGGPAGEGEADMQAVETKKERGPRNGVDTPTLFATLDAVKGQPELAKFQFRVSNRWVKGTQQPQPDRVVHRRRRRARAQARVRVRRRPPRRARRERRGADARSSSCCTRSRRASPPASPTSRPRAA